MRDTFLEHVIVAVDPGEHTGLAVFQPSPTNPKLTLRTVPGGLEGFVNTWKRRMWSPRIILCEQMHPTPDMPRDSWLINGWVIGQGMAYGGVDKSLEVPMSSHKRLSSPAKMAAYGVPIDFPHEEDALSILHWYLCNREKLNLPTEVAELMARGES